MNSTLLADFVGPQIPADYAILTAENHTDVRTMKVSKRERYALRMMIDLGQHSRDGRPIGVRAIAERQQIARRYLEQIASQLKLAGLVTARQGQSGGYYLARPPSEISIGEILEAVAGPVLVMDCLSNENLCDRSRECPSRRMWSLLEKLMQSLLHQYFLDDLLESRFPPAKSIDDTSNIGRCPLVSFDAPHEKQSDPPGTSQDHDESS